MSLPKNDWSKIYSTFRSSSPTAKSSDAPTRLHIPQRIRHLPFHRRDPGQTERRMGGSEAVSNGAGSDHAFERHSDCRIARRGNLTGPAMPAKTVTKPGLLNHARGTIARSTDWLDFPNETLPTSGAQSPGSVNLACLNRLGIRSVFLKEITFR